MAKTIIKINAIPNTYWEFAEPTLFPKRYSRLYVKGEYSSNYCRSYDSHNDWEYDMEQAKSLASFLNICSYQCETMSMSEENITNTEEFKMYLRLIKTSHIEFCGSYPNLTIHFRFDYPLFPISLFSVTDKILCKSVSLNCINHTIEVLGSKETSNFVRLKKDLSNDLFSIIRKTIRASYLLTIERQKKWYSIIHSDNIVNEAKKTGFLK